MKNINMILFWGAAVLLLLVSCGGNISVDGVGEVEEVDTATLYKISICDELGTESRATLNDIAKSLDFLQLQLTKRSLLSSLKFEMGRIGDKLFALSFSPSGSPVIQFDTLGNFERVAVNVGRASNEILSSVYRADFYADRFVINQGRKSLVYQNGKGSSIITDGYYYQLVALNDGSFVGLSQLGPDAQHSSLLDFIDVNAKVQHTIELDNSSEVNYPLRQGYTGRWETFQLTPSYSGDALFKGIFTDTISLVKSNSDIEPYIILESGEYSPKVEDYENQERIHVKDVLEMENYILVSYGFSDMKSTVVWDKRSKEVAARSTIKYSDSNSLINSRFFLDYVTPTGELIKVGVGGFYRDLLYCVVRPQDAVKFREGYTIEDNPLIIIAEVR